MNLWLALVAFSTLSCSLQAPRWNADSAVTLSREEAGFAAPPASESGSEVSRVHLPEPVVAGAPAVPADEPTVERQVIYAASLRLVVVSAREAHAAIVAAAKKVGGYLQESDARSVTIRVPAAAFEETLKRVGELGEVVDSNVRASDVTEEMLDLDIRLENARKARERLLAHLEKSDKIEDTLKIEAELTRLSGEIERMEGRLRYVRSQVALSTIRVELNTNEPQRASDGLDLPFDWVARLGDGLVAGTVKSNPKKPWFFSRGPRFDPPADFVRYFSSDDLVEALNAQGVRLKLQRHENYDEGGLAFWKELARKGLVTTRSLAVVEERDLGEDRALVRGTRDVGSQTFGYLLVVARTKSNVYTFEAWGPRETFEPLVPALVESAKSLRR